MKGKAVSVCYSPIYAYHLTSNVGRVTRDTRLKVARMLLVNWVTLKIHID